MLDDKDEEIEGGSLTPIEKFYVYDSKFNLKTGECWIIFEKEKWMLINHNGLPQRSQESIGVTLDTMPVARTDTYGDPGDWRLEEVTKAEFQNGIHLIGLPIMECTSKLMYVL
jgi:hypothetical protein